jgi:hypothetical protein
VRSIGKLLCLAILPALLLFVAGCGGINVSKTVTPLDFLLPGLLKADPPPTHPDRDLPTDPPVTLIAQN